MAPGSTKLDWSSDADPEIALWLLGNENYAPTEDREGGFDFSEEYHDSDQSINHRGHRGTRRFVVRGVA